MQSSTYIAESQIRAALNYLSRGRRKWRSTDIHQIQPQLEDARKAHPALRGEAEVRYDDLKTAKDARYLANRFARLTQQDVFPVRIAPGGEPPREVLVTLGILQRTTKDPDFFLELYSEGIPPMTPDEGWIRVVREM